MEETREKSRIGSRNLMAYRCRESISVSQATRPAISMCKTYEIKTRKHGVKLEGGRETGRCSKKTRDIQDRREEKKKKKKPAQSQRASKVASAVSAWRRRCCVGRGGRERRGLGQSEDRLKGTGYKRGSVQ